MNITFACEIIPLLSLKYFFFFFLLWTATATFRKVFKGSGTGRTQQHVSGACILNVSILVDHVHLLNGVAAIEIEVNLPINCDGSNALQKERLYSNVFLFAVTQ